MNHWPACLSTGLTALVSCGALLFTLEIQPQTVWAAGIQVTSAQRAIINGGLLLTQVKAGDGPKASATPGAAQICRTSQTLADAECFRLLKTWVMPEGNPANWRLSVFRLSADEIGQPNRAGVRPFKTVRMVHGTTLASPAYELFEAANRSGKLAELRQAIDASKVDSELGRRNLVALQILAAIAAKDDSLAKSKLKDQLVLVKSIDSNNFTTRDPEHLVMIGLIDQPQWMLTAKSLIVEMWEKYGNNLRQAPLQSERSLNDTVDQLIAEQPCLSDVQRPRPKKLTQWHPAPMETAVSRASGTNSAVWSLHQGVARLSSGETPSQLFFQSPLKGNFEVTCEMSTYSFREGSLGYGMFGVCPRWDLNGVHTLPVLGRPGTNMNSLKLPRWDSIADVRVVVRDGQMINYVNGVRIHATELNAVPDPWLVVHTFNPWYSTSVRNVRITGSPQIPTEVNLSEITGLVNWRADYFNEQVGAESDATAHWFQYDDEIVSRQQPQPNAKRPGLLIHQRPLSFNGDLTYEFFCEPGKIEIHPTLGQMVWLLSSKQIQQRRLSDFSAAPSVTSDNSKAAVKPLPSGLIPNQWNRVRLSIKESTVALAVNDKQVDEQPIDAANTRQFGLFRQNDVSSSRVRNVRWRGDWPKTLPVVEDQELAIPAAGLFVGKVWPMKGRLKLDTSMAEIRKLTFWTNVTDEYYTETPEGIELSLNPNRTGSGVTELAWPHALRGDFDITTTISSIRLASKTAPEVSLRVVFDDEVSSGLAIVVGENRQKRKQLMADHTRRPTDDSYWFERWEKHVELKSGRLRIAREDGRAFLFYAEDDGEFQLLTTYSVGNADVKGVTMWTQIHGPDGNLQAVYKELTINADEIVD